MTLVVCFFFNDTATTEIYTLSLHDALPISSTTDGGWRLFINNNSTPSLVRTGIRLDPENWKYIAFGRDRKSTRLNSSHANISYAVFCLKKKKIKSTPYIRAN